MSFIPLAAIRKVIYTTNTIEGYHRQIRNVTKTKGSFPNDMSLMQLVYLAADRIEDGWAKKALDGWALAAAQLHIIFEGRMPLRLTHFSLHSQLSFSSIKRLPQPGKAQRLPDKANNLLITSLVGVKRAIIEDLFQSYQP
jgi:hypothetical protein